MATDHILGGRFPGRGQGNHIIGGVVDQFLIGQGTKRPCHRRVADFKTLGDVLRPYRLFLGDDVKNGSPPNWLSTYRSMSFSTSLAV